MLVGHMVYTPVIHSTCQQVIGIRLMRPNWPKNIFFSPMQCFPGAKKEGKSVKAYLFEKLSGLSNPLFS